MSSRLACRTVRSLRSICARTTASWRRGIPAARSSSRSSRAGAGVRPRARGRASPSMRSAWRRTLATSSSTNAGLSDISATIFWILSPLAAIALARAARFVRPGDLPLKPAQPSERQEHGLEFPRVELAAFRQHDDVVGRDLATTQPVADVEEGLDGHRHTGESPAERHLSDFDPAADLDFLRRGQERDLADLLEVQADRVLATRGGGGLEDERPGGLLDLLFESDGRLRLVGAGVKRPWGRPRRLKSRCLTAFPECHDVTKLDSFYVYDA